MLSCLTSTFSHKELAQCPLSLQVLFRERGLSVQLGHSDCGSLQPMKEVGMFPQVKREKN
jgi:hypothetical protein